MSQRTVLITGASSGIGAAFAEVFAAEGFDLVLTARREDRLHSLAERLRRAHSRKVDVLVADLSQVDAPTTICGEITRRGLTIDGLVNCAGVAAAERVIARISENPGRLARLFTMWANSPMRALNVSTGMNQAMSIAVKLCETSSLA